MTQTNDSNEHLYQKFVYAFKSQFNNAFCVRVARNKLLSEEKETALLNLFPYVCSKCYLRFVSNVDLNNHLKLYKTVCDNAFCECCGNIYSDLDNLLRHESIDHVDKTLTGGDSQVEIIGENHALFASNMNVLNNFQPYQNHNHLMGNVIQQNTQTVGLTMVPCTNNAQLIGSPMQSMNLNNCQLVRPIMVASTNNAQLIGSPMQSMNLNNCQLVRPIMVPSTNNAQLIGSPMQSVNLNNCQSVRLSMVPCTNNAQLIGSPMQSMSLNNCQTIKPIMVPCTDNAQLIGSPMQSMSLNNSQAVGQSTMEVSNQTRSISNVSTTPNNTNLPSNASMPQYLGINSSSPVKFVNYKSNISTNSSSTSSENLISSKKSANLCLNDPNECIAVVYYSCNVCNKNILDAEDFDKHYESEHGNSNKNQSQDELKHISNNTRKLDSQLSSVTQLQKNIDDLQQESQPFESETTDQYLQHQSPEMLSSTINENNSEKQSVAISSESNLQPPQRSSGDDDQYSPIEDAEREENFADADSYSCQECGRRFVSTYNLRRHYKASHTDPATWPFQCNYCQKLFSIRGELKRHLRIHTNERPYACEVCHVQFKQVGHLTKHIISMHHKQLAKKNLPNVDAEESDRNDTINCQECGKRFVSTYNLRRHYKASHTDPATWPFQCNYCQKLFSTRGELKRHLQIHTNERPYACEVCHVQFKQVRHLAQHNISMRHKQLAKKNLPNVDAEESDRNDLKDAGENGQVETEN